MRIKSLYFPISFILVLFSCTKNDNPTPIYGSKIKTIKTVISGSNQGTFYNNYFYNNDGTIDYTTVSFSNNNYISKTTYTYSTNKIIIKNFDTLNVLREYGEFLLRTDGLVDSSFTYFIPPDSVFSYKYIYNANNEPIQIKTYVYPYGSFPSSIPKIITNWTFSNGNLITASYFIQLTGELRNVIYEYYNTVSNLTPEAYGMPYNLIQSINLVKTVKSTSDLSMDTHTYTFDGNNRVATDLTKYFDRNGTLFGESIYTYTYY